MDRAVTGPSETILVLNAGSSSLEFALYEKSDGLPLVLRGSDSSLNANPRLRIGHAAGWPGVKIDPDLNARGGPDINASASSVIPTDEERAVAEEAFRSG